jgi:outer membrane immunogenic protein
VSKSAALPYHSLNYEIWTGFYAGVNGGYGWFNNETFTLDTFVTATGQDFRTVKGNVFLDGAFGGGQIGYNWQFPGGFKDVPSNWVIGIAADLQGPGIKGSGAHIDTLAANGIVGTRTGSATVDVDCFGTVRGRLGYAAGPTLIYGTGGLAYGGVNAHYKFSDTFGPNSGSTGRSSVETGWVAGGGIERKLSPAWSIEAEYQYIDLGTVTRSGPLLTLPTYTMKGETDVNFSTVRAGINYHFGSVYEPLK